MVLSQEFYGEYSFGLGEDLSLAKLLNLNSRISMHMKYGCFLYTYL
jgi:hypothetical protein